MSRRRNNQPAIEPPLPSWEPGEEPLPAIDPPPEFLEDRNGVGIDDYSAPEDVMNDLPADPEVRRAEPVLKPTGAFMDLGFIEQINNAPTDEEAKAMYNALDPALKRVYDRSYGMNISPEWAAGVAQEFYKEKDQMAAQANDPARQVAAAKGQVEVAEKQRVMQQAYLEEVQYQNNLNLVADPNTDRTTRRAALNAIDGLAATIGKRSMGGVASRDAMRDAKKSVGSISVMQEYNPFADYGPQIDLMRRGSEERMGVLRQQMEAAGVTMPEAKQVEAAKGAQGPDAAEVAMQRFGVKLPDGNPLMIDGSPVIQVTKGGQSMMLKRAANGKFVELTEADRAKLPQ
jgi:hypothetical protein